jgi:beta-glucanase (GH16 family)
LEDLGRHLAAFLLAAATGLAAAQCPGDLRRLTFADEFDGTSLNTATWSHETGRWPYNAELQHYQLGNASVGGGFLTITATRDNRFNPPYASARINTRTSFLQRYGRFEMRARMPRGQGIWPAFWLLPQNAWPPEIDIMELLGHEPTRVHFTNHWGTAAAPLSQTSSFSGPDFSAGFHTFACEWSPGRIDFFVDGVRRATNINGGVPSVPMYIILNLAVGGLWPGNPNASTQFPQQMVVDWVRAYELIEPASQIANGGFESRGPTGQVPFFGWVRSGNAFTDAGAARTGSASGKLFGNFTGGVNTSWISQDLLVTPGQTMAATGWFQTVASDRIAGANVASMIIEWRTSTNAVLARESVVAADATMPPGEWIRRAVAAEVPAGASRARLLIEFRQPAMAAGSVFFDDILFGPITCPGCLSDFNADGGVDGGDLDAFFAAWETGSDEADANRDGGVDGADVGVFFEAWERSSC